MATHFLKPRGVVARKIRDSVILVPLGGGETATLDHIYTLNPTAAIIWEKTLAGMDRAAIAEEISRSHEVSTGEALQDVDVLLSELISLGVLVSSDECGGVPGTHA